MNITLLQYLRGEKNTLLVLPNRLMLELDRREGEIKQFGILRSKSEWEGKRSDQLSCGPPIAFEGRNWASMDKKRSPIMKRFFLFYIF